MNIAFGPYIYQEQSSSGGNAHIYQFISNATSLGHKVWAWPNDEHEETVKLPKSKISRLVSIRKMDCIYLRLESDIPTILRVLNSPYKHTIRSVIKVWEFNTIPEFNLMRGHSTKSVEKIKRLFNQYSENCDIAICVSKEISNYVREHFNIPNIHFVPNGSDPDQFNPEIVPEISLLQYKNNLNVVWMGSGNLQWHNLPLLIHTANKIQNEYPSSKIKFHLIGDGLDQGFQFPENCIVHGPVAYLKLPQYLTVMDIGLVIYKPGASDFNSPLKLFDYLSSGLTVVGTPQPQFVDIMRELNLEELIVPLERPDFLASLLLNLESDNLRRDNYRKIGRQIIVDKYNWRKSVTDTLDIIESWRSDMLF